MGMGHEGSLRTRDTLALQLRKEGKRPADAVRLLSDPTRQKEVKRLLLAAQMDSKAA